MYIPTEALLSGAVHIALLLACASYAAFLAQPHIYRAYHPHNTIYTVIGGEVLVGLAFGVECIIAAAWIRFEPLVAAGFFATLHGAAAIPIWRWQMAQAAQEKARVAAIEERLAEEEREHATEDAGR